MNGGVKERTSRRVASKPGTTQQPKREPKNPDDVWVDALSEGTRAAIRKLKAAGKLPRKFPHNQ